MGSDKALLVSTTFERQEHADDLARSLIQKRLVACAQVQGPVKSMYWWKDEVAESVEFLLTLKTMESCYQKLEEAILQDHPYDVPEIIATPIERVSNDYLSWLQGELGL